MVVSAPEFHERLVQAFKASPKSQRDVAQELEIREATVSAWIKHGTIPEGDQLLRLPVILECDAHWLLTGEQPKGVEYVARRLSEIVDELARNTGYPLAYQASPQADWIPKGQNRDRMPQGPEAIKKRFLAAIHGFTDLEVEEICGINHETVRQWRKGDGPVRAPNRESTKKILVMIATHEAVMRENAILSGEKLPPEAAGLIEFAEDRRDVAAFVEKYPKLGWIYLADELAKTARDLNRMTIYDEFMWLGYKRAHNFDPDTASRVTPEDVGIDVPKFFENLGEDGDLN